MGAVYHGVTAGVALTADFAAKNPVAIASDATITGNPAGYRGAAVYASGYAWTIANQGTITATGSGANGVSVEAGGVVVNGASDATSAVVSGVYTGIATYAAPATIINYGTIAGTGTAFQLPGYISGLGIYLGGGGRITNGASGSTAAVIEGYTTAITVKDSAGTIVNFGTLANTAFGDTIYLNSGAAGSVIVNQAGGLITGRSAIDTTPATAVSGGVVIANYGTIASTDSTAADIYLGHGGQLTNAASGLIASRYTGVSLAGGPATLVNAGTIASSGTGIASAAINLGAGGTIVNTGLVVTTGYKSNAIELSSGVVVNGASGATGALVSGVYTGIATYAPTTIINYGTIAATGTAFQLPVYISGVSIYLGGGGLITNGAAGSTAAVIAGYTTAITVKDSAGTIVNYGTLANTAFGDTIYLNSGAAGTTIINQAGGLITGRSAIDTTPATAVSGGVVIANYGTIASTDSTAADIYLGHGGQLTNGPGGLIASLYTGISLAGGPATLVNAGTIASSGGIAIMLGGAADEIVIEAGSQLVGAVGNFRPGDSFDLPFLAFDSSGSVGLDGNELAVDESSGSFAIVLDPSQNFAGDLFHLSADATGGTLVTETQGQPAPRDFDANGTSDMLWQNDNGAVAIWEMNGTSILNLAGDAVIGADPSWHIRGTGDFNGDGTSDILWQNDNGAVAIWEMNGTSILNLASDGVSGVDPSWHIRGTGDFNGDGTSDILWQNDNGAVAIWEMNGTSILNLASDAVSAVDPSWHIRGTGDFNGDGTSDILWQNDNGAVAIWEMNGTSILNLASDSVINIDPSWHIRGTGDFNGDGKSDMLWQNDNGAVAIWEMNGTSILNLASDFVISLDSTWHIRGTGDFNGDGKSEILWQNDNGAVAIWEMNGTSILNLASDSVIGADPSWHIIPPDNTGDIAPAASAGASAAGFGFADISGTAAPAAPPGDALPQAAGGGALLPAAAPPNTDPAPAHSVFPA